MLGVFWNQLPPPPKLIAPHKSGVEDPEEWLEVEKAERCHAHALDHLSAKCDRPNFHGQIVSVWKSVPIDELTNRSDTDPSSSVSITKAIPCLRIFT